MVLYCNECGKEFELKRGEVNFYERKGFSLPKRCKECRKYAIGDLPGMKKNSFLKNSNIYGVPVAVEGGTSIVHAYIVEALGDTKKYLNIDKQNHYFFSEDIANATFVSEENGKKIIDKLLENNNKCYSYRLLPRSYYEKMN